MRTFLSTLSASAKALTEEVGPSKPLESIREDLHCLQQTFEAMEQFSAPLPVERHPEDLLELLGQAVKAAQEKLKGLGYDITPVQVAIHAPRSVRLTVCRRLIHLALTNVIKNALEAFGSRRSDALSPGRIEVIATVEGYDTRIAVRDNGRGIEPEILQEILNFVPGPRNKSKRESAGWGLCLSHRYVAAHGGTLNIESQVDRGATVTITLPMRSSTEG